MTTAIITHVSSQQAVSFADRLKNPALIEKVDQMIASFDPAALTLQSLLQIGQSAERSLAGNLDRILSEFDKENSPFVFDAFQELQEGLRAANLDELEKKIKEARKPRGFLGLFGFRGISQKKISEFTAALSRMLKGKRETLLDLVKKMEDSARKESEMLLKTMGRLDSLAQSHILVADEFAQSLLYIDGVLEKAQVHAQLLADNVSDTENVAGRFQAEQYGELLVHLQNRRLILMSAYERTPAELDMIAMSKKAAANTFIEVSTALIQQLNGIKTSLAKWAMLIAVENSQQGEKFRREIAADLLHYGVAILDRVSIVAAGTPYERRLEDAELLLGMRKGIAAIQERVLQIEKSGEESFRKAEAILLESRRPLLTLG